MFSSKLSNSTIDNKSNINDTKEPENKLVKTTVVDFNNSKGRKKPKMIN